VEIILACVGNNSGGRRERKRDITEAVEGRVGSTHLGIIAGYFLIIPFGGHLYAVAIGLIIVNSFISYLSTLNKKRAKIQSPRKSS